MSSIGIWSTDDGISLIFTSTSSLEPIWISAYGNIAMITGIVE